MHRLIPLIFLLALFLGCGDGDSDSSATEPVATTAAAPEPEPAPSHAAKQGTKVVLGDSQFGRILFNSKRQAIYLFDKETSSKPACYGACAEAWPPVYADGKPRLGKGLDRELLGIVKRRGGRKQISYGGHPLYYYAHEGPGQVLCHDIGEFGGLWLVVKKNGDPAPSSR